MGHIISDDFTLERDMRRASIIPIAGAIGRIDLPLMVQFIMEAKKKVPNIQAQSSPDEAFLYVRKSMAVIVSRVRPARSIIVN
jgi:hypothetical protein